MTVLQRISQNVRAHWLRTLIALICAVSFAAFLAGPLRRVMITSPDLAAMYALLLVLLTVNIAFPRVAGIGMAVLSMVSVVVFLNVYESPFSLAEVIPILVAYLMGSLAYSATLGISLPCCVMVCLSYVLPHRYLIPMAGLLVPDIGCVLECIAAFALGYALRLQTQLKNQQTQENELLRLRAQSEKLDRMRTRVDLQRLIHDSIAGDLSYIALITRPHAGQPVDADRIETVHHHAIAALTHTRQAIAMLSDETPLADGTAEYPASPNPIMPDTAMKQSGTVPADLVKMIAQCDADLRGLGLDGGTTVLASSDFTLGQDSESLDRWDAVMSLMHEIYANIVAHGQLDGVYAVQIRLINGEARIHAENATGESTSMSPILGSGTGLARQRQRIEQVHGSLDTFAQDGRFSLFAEIPLVIQ